MQGNLTQGSVWKNLIRFSLPFLLSSFLQTFYGLADLYIIGQFRGAGSITAVSVGSQITHMLTVIIVGLAMGTTVTISRALGAGDEKQIAKGIGNTVVLFAAGAIFLTAILLLCTNGILQLLSTPKEAMEEAKRYITICFLGVPFITAYNVISSIFRGLGDSKRPMYFVGIAGVLNILLDYLLIGALDLGAAGAALATIISQACSVLLALMVMGKLKLGIHLIREDFRIDPPVMKNILKVGLPVAAQDGFVQISFLVITVIANRRGVDAAAAVGIVEKLISFMFLVPSAMLSTVSAMAAQNAGAGFHERGRRALYYGIGITILVGFLFVILCQIWPEQILSLFAKEEPAVVQMGAQYLRSYVFDCAIAGVHFCFSGYFCAYQKSMISFGHNMASILLVRIPGAYFASRKYPDTLFPMGMAAPLGSLLSSLICVTVFLIMQRQNRQGGKS